MPLQILRRVFACPARDDDSIADDDRARLAGAGQGGAGAGGGNGGERPIGVRVPGKRRMIRVNRN